jgi:hypothetical protein
MHWGRVTVQKSVDSWIAIDPPEIMTELGVRKMSDLVHLWTILGSDTEFKRPDLLRTTD